MNRLLNKLLGRHINAWQLAGFVLANLCGMAIVLAAVQLASDIKPLFEGSDSFLRPGQVVVTKRVNSMGTLTGASPAFTEKEIGRLRRQPFVKNLGQYTPAMFSVFATLVNADFIEKMDIHYGDWLLVEKGGEIIPKVVGVDLSKRQPGSQPVAYITNCPECGARLVRAEGEAGHYCPNQDNCPPQIIGRLEHFVSRKAMNIDSLGSERLELLYRRGLVHSVADLYALRRDQLIGLETFDETGQRKTSIQEKGADNIISAIEKSKDVPFERLLFALGIRFVGEVGARKLALHFNNMDNLMRASLDELASVDDVGEKTAAVIYDYLRDPRHQQLISRLQGYGLQFQVNSDNYQMSNELDGKSFVVSGVFSRFSRDEIKAHIQQHGGKVVSAISGKTDYLLAGEKMGPEKLKKAEKLGVPIISEDQYMEMIKS